MSSDAIWLSITSTVSIQSYVCLVMFDMVFTVNCSELNSFQKYWKIVLVFFSATGPTISLTITYQLNLCYNVKEQKSRIKIVA